MDLTAVEIELESREIVTYQCLSDMALNPHPEAQFWPHTHYSILYWSFMSRLIRGFEDLAAPFNTICEFGTGNGFLVNYARHYNFQAVGTDIQAKNIELALANSSDKNGYFLADDPSRWITDEMLYLVGEIMMTCLSVPMLPMCEHWEDEENPPRRLILPFLEDSFRLLQKGGYSAFVISDLHDLAATKADLASVGFEIARGDSFKIQEMNYSVPEFYTSFPGVMDYARSINAFEKVGDKLQVYGLLARKPF